jgi:hypothetical protein
MFLSIIPMQKTRKCFGLSSLLLYNKFSTNNEFVTQMNQLKISPEKKSNEKFDILSNRKLPPSVGKHIFI